MKEPKTKLQLRVPLSPADEKALRSVMQRTGLFGTALVRALLRKADREQWEFLDIKDPKAPYEPLS